MRCTHKVYNGVITLITAPLYRSLGRYTESLILTQANIFYSQNIVYIILNTSTSYLECSYIPHPYLWLTLLWPPIDQPSVWDLAVVSLIERRNQNLRTKLPHSTTKVQGKWTGSEVYSCTLCSSSGTASTGAETSREISGVTRITE